MQRKLNGAGSPSLQRKTDTEPDTEPETEEQKKAREEHAAKVTADFEKLLGTWLGGTLAPLVLEHVSVQDLQGYAQMGIKAIGPAVAKAIQGLTKPEDVTEAGQKAFGTELGSVAEGLAAKLAGVPCFKKLLAAISGVVEEHPDKVVAMLAFVAISGAIVVVMANASLPELKIPFQLGKTDWKMEAGVSLSQLKELGFNGASLAVQNKTKTVKLKAKYKNEQETNEAGDVNETHTADVSGSVNLTKDAILNAGATVVVGEETTKIKLNGGMTFKTPDGTTGKVSGEYTANGPIKVKLRLGDDKKYTEFEGTKNGDEITVNTKSVDGSTTLNRKVTQHDDGKVTNTNSVKTELGKGVGANMTAGDENQVGVSYNNGEGLNANASVGSSGAKLGLGYKGEDGYASFEAQFKENLFSFKGAAGFEKDGFMAKTNAEFDAEGLKNLAFKAGYALPSGFLNKIETEYKYSKQKGIESHKFGAALEYTIGNWMGRIEGGVGLKGGNVDSYNAGASGSFPIGTTGWKGVGALSVAGKQGANSEMQHQAGIFVGAEFAGTVVGLQGNIGLSGNQNDLTALELSMKKAIGGGKKERTGPVY